MAVLCISESWVCVVFDGLVNLASRMWYLGWYKMEFWVILVFRMGFSCLGFSGFSLTLMVWFNFCLIEF